MGRRVKAWAKALQRDVLAVYLAARDPRTPALARWLALAVAAYALSPIDLIPDVIPILGLVDDLLLLPLGVMLVRRLLPDEVLADARQRAAEVLERPRSRAGAVAIVLVWLLALGAGAAVWLGRA